MPDLDTPQCPVRHDFDPLSTTYLADPYPFGNLVRDESPVFYSPEMDMWIVSRLADVEAVFLDHESFSGRIVQNPVFPVCAAAKDVLGERFDPLPVMSNNDPPDHARIRQFTARGFSPRRMAALEPYVRARADEYVGRLIAAGGPIDYVTALAYPLPARTVFALIGFPATDADQIKQWCGRRLTFSWGRASESDQVEIAGDMLAYWQYCQDFVDARWNDRERGITADDFVGELLDAHADHPDQLTLPEVKSVVYGLSFAGHESVTNLLSNTLITLLGDRSRWEQVCADPTLIPAAIEEVIRFDNSQISWRRIANRDTVVGGVEIPEGATVHLLLGAANHDPSRFEDPEVFDLRRSNSRRNVSFGKGIHLCLGAAMARMEARVVLEVLVERLPGLRMAEQELDYLPNVQFRGPASLLVEWDVL